MNTIASSNHNAKSENTPLYQSPHKVTTESQDNFTISKPIENKNFNPTILQGLVQIEKNKMHTLIREYSGIKGPGFSDDVGRPYKKLSSHYNNKMNYSDIDNNLSKTQEFTPKPIQSSSKQIDPKALQQLLSLQLQLSQNPNLVQQTQSLLDNHFNGTPLSNNSGKPHNNNLVQIVGDLEQEIVALKRENNQSQQTIKDLKYELITNKQQLTIQQNKTENLIHELECHQELRDKLDEYTLLIQKLESELEYHHKNHAELRKELFNKTTAEYQISKLKRELH